MDGHIDGWTNRHITWMDRWTAVKKTLLQLIHRGFETETNDLFTHSEVTHDKID